MEAKEIDEWLDGVDYGFLNSNQYSPSEFALTFMNFIKLVNGSEGESNKTPPMHLKMLDTACEDFPYIANLCFRGSGKTTLFSEYFILYLAIFRWLPNFGAVSSLIYVSDSMDNGVKSLRKNIEFRYYQSEFLQKWLPQAKFTDAYVEFTNTNGEVFAYKGFGAQSGLRGTKIFGKRPPIAILDDLVSDDDANSRAALIAIKNTIYKGVNHALDPTRRKIIYNGTPFNKEDPLVEAVESGAWRVNVWPVCEQFPVKEKDFVSAWPDRFTFKYIKSQYDLAEKTGKLSSFYQELMLRISSEEERLVQDKEINWYQRAFLLARRNVFNFYITTDFATSKKTTADNSVISVWAYNANGDWFWVDGMCKRTTMDDSIDQLFYFVQEYKPQSVGIETTGQQGAFIQWLQQEQMNRNIWFNFASSKKAGEPGIHPIQDKLSRFNLVVPWFKSGKMYFPEEMKESAILRQFMQEIRLATVSGLKGKDDCLDTISMLGFIKAWKPSDSIPTTPKEIDMWEEEHPEETQNQLASYIV